MNKKSISPNSSTEKYLVNSGKVINVIDLFKTAATPYIIVSLANNFILFFKFKLTIALTLIYLS